MTIIFGGKCRRRLTGGGKNFCYLPANIGRRQIFLKFPRTKSGGDNYFKILTGKIRQRHDLIAGFTTIADHPPSNFSSPQDLPSTLSSLRLHFLINCNVKASGRLFIRGFLRVTTKVRDSELKFL